MNMWTLLWSKAAKFVVECFARAAAPRPAVIRQHFRADKSIKIFMRPRDPTRAAPCTRSRHTWGAVEAGCEILQASQVLHKFCKLKCKCKGEGEGTAGRCRLGHTGSILENISLCVIKKLKIWSSLTEIWQLMSGEREGNLWTSWMMTSDSAGDHNTAAASPGQASSRWHLATGHDRKLASYNFQRRLEVANTCSCTNDEINDSCYQVENTRLPVQH